MRKKPKVYVYMFLSYIMMLVIPVFTGMLIYGYSWRAICRQAERMNGIILEMMQRELDSRMSDVQKAAVQLSMNTEVQRVAVVKGKISGNYQMNLYYLYNDLQAIKLSEDFIDDIFVYFPNSQMVCSLAGNMSAQLFYELYYKNEGNSYETFLESLEGFHYSDVECYRKPDGTPAMFLTMSSLGSSIKNPAATIVISVEFSRLQERASSMKDDESMRAYIVGERMRIPLNEEGDPPYEITYENLETGNSMETGENGERIMVSVAPSETMEWKYVSMIPARTLETDAKGIQILSVAGLFICGIVGFGLSGYMTRKNYNPLKSLIESFRKYGNTDIGRNDNVYQWLHDQMDVFFQKHIDAEKLIRANRKQLRNYYLYQLLCQYEEVPEKELEKYTISFSHDYNAVVLFELKERRLEEENVLRRFIIKNIFEEMCREYFNVEIVEMGEKVAAIANLPENTMNYMGLLKEQVENLQVMTEESFHFQCLAYMGTAQKGQSGIHTSYLQACELEPYSALLDTDLVVYDDVKNRQRQYDYPFETEQKILNAIEAGDAKTAGELIAQVFDRNLSGQTSADVYRYLVYDMVGTLLRGANLGGYSDAVDDLDFPDGLAMKAMHVKDLKERFGKLAETICQEVQQRKRQMDMDKSMSRKIEAYIQEHFTDPDMNISIASQHFDLTPAYLSSVYKKQTGKSLLDYINTLRVQKGQELLEQGYSVAKIASIAGFRGDRRNRNGGSGSGIFLSHGSGRRADLLVRADHYRFRKLFQSGRYALWQGLAGADGSGH